METRKTWQEFQDTGLLWWINRILHLFGWAVVLVVEADSTISDVYPARVPYRGFDEQTEKEKFKVLSAYLNNNIVEINKEIQDA
jgi:hypothetical protein